MVHVNGSNLYSGDADRAEETVVQVDSRVVNLNPRQNILKKK